jgi:hypothetical protein
MGSSVQTAIVWVSCDYCNVWYHDFCIKRSHKNRDSQEKLPSYENSFKCELCCETERLLTGESGKILDKFDTCQELTVGNDFLSIDRLSYCDHSLLSSKLTGQP